MTREETIIYLMAATDGVIGRQEQIREMEDELLRLARRMLSEMRLVKLEVTLEPEESIFNE